MMGWKEAEKRYTSGKALASRSVEDAVARATLSGMGLSQKTAYRAGRAFGIAYDPDKALWPFTLELFNAAVLANTRIRMFKVPGSPERAMARIDVLEYTKPDKSDVISALSETYQSIYDTTPVIFGRPKKNPQRGAASAFIPVPTGTEVGGRVYPFNWLMTPPVVLLAEIGSAWVAEVSVKSFVSGLVGGAVDDRLNSAYG